MTRRAEIWLSFFTRNLHIISKRRSRMSSFDFEDKLFSLSANGKLAELKALTSLSKTNINAANPNGWTALMYAARNGHADVVKLLVENGAEKDKTNSLGQTALDIAAFWSQHPVIAALTPPLADKREPLHFFTVRNLNRASEMRKDSKLLAEMLSSSSDARIVVFVKNFPLLSTNGKRYTLKMFKYSDLKDLINLEKLEVIFLGIQRRGDEVSHSGSPLFAANISHDKLELLLTSFSNENLQALEKLRDAFILDAEQASLAGLAHSLFDWHSRHEYCPTCAHKTDFSEAGYKRKCTNESCLASREVKNTSYPRLDPTIIVAVMSSDRTQLLLARGRKFLPKMWSCLAGFMEPGESIEDACRREVFEESGITIGHVGYHSSQPWPFPTQLMIGLVGQATTQTITVDKSELDEARWFSRAEVIKMTMRKHPEGFFIPPHQAIAHHLIKAFLHDSASKI
ncbi:NAD-capped RNA hydrolase NUDT12-like [Watersipora subatra]|uniref:NAD-capped RNA hydrolase NUDT12-like n=1 Tax=Watersipora subatra TaxID=2589382 RepID=UPI00355AD273